MNEPGGPLELIPAFENSGGGVSETERLKKLQAQLELPVSRHGLFLIRP